MEKYEYIPGEKYFFNGALIALGLFDGVHRGHRYLLKRAKALAEEMQLPFAVFTFRSEGALQKNAAPIYSTENKLNILESIGADAVVLADFEKTKGISASDFINLSLIEDMNCRAAVCGEDFRFGSSAQGNADMLKSKLGACGRTVLVVDEQKAGNEKISTTRIKALLAAGSIPEANSLLGKPYFINGEVSHGNGFGKKLGFPTVNTDIPKDVFRIKTGVYLSFADIDGIRQPAITNIGTCPTFSERPLHAETYLMDFNGDLYGRRLEISFLDFIRGEVKFNTPEELTAQIKADEEKAKFDWRTKWQETGLS